MIILKIQKHLFLFFHGVWNIRVYTQETYNLILLSFAFFYMIKQTIYNIILFFYGHAFVQDKIIFSIFCNRYKLIFSHKVLFSEHKPLKGKFHMHY